MPPTDWLLAPTLAVQHAWCLRCTRLITGGMATLAHLGISSCILIHHLVLRHRLLAEEQPVACVIMTSHEQLWRGPAGVHAVHPRGGLRIALPTCQHSSPDVMS